MGLPEVMSPDLEKLLDGSGWVRSLARSLVADPHAADDLVQEAWVVALQRAPDGADRPGLRRWLAAVVRNLARDRRRGEGRRSERERLVASDGEGGGDAAEMLERLDTHQRIVAAVRALDEPYRSAVLLRYFEGASPAEIARRLGVPLRTVHSRLNRALSKLRAKLRGDFGGGRGTWLLALLPLSRPGGWGAGALSGALIMDAKLKLTFAGVALAGVAAVATLSREDATPPEAVVAAAPARPDATLEAPAVDDPAEVPRSNERAPALEEAEPSDAVAAPAEEPEIEAAPVGELRGRVLDVDGTPVPGVRVGIRPSGRAAAEVESRTTTGRDGRFRFESTLAAEERGATPGEVVILDERYTPVLLPTTHLGAASDANLVLVVAPLQPLGGIVVDTAGNPLPGARLTIDLAHDFHARFGEVLEHCRIVRWNATSDGAGRFELPEAPRMDPGVLVTTCAGFARDVRSLPDEPTPGLEIVLGAEQEDVTLIEGTVVDLTGRPVEGAYVALEFSNGTTDAEGNFSLRMHGPGDRGVLMALKRGMLPARIERVGDSDIAAGAWPEPLVLTLGGAPLTIRGRVVDAKGEPLAGVKVWTSDTTHFGAIEAPDFGPMMTVATDVETLLRDPEDDDRKTETGADGTFVIEGLMNKDYRVSIHDEATVGFHRTEPVPAGTTGLVVTLPTEERIPRVAGRVVGLDGDPIAGVSIALCRLLEPKNGYTDDIASSSVRTDGEGRFEFRDMPASLTHARISGQGLDIMGNRLAIPDAADLEDLEFAVARRCRLRVELGDAGEGDGFQLLDADDGECQLTVFRGNVAWSTAQGSLVEGRSEAVSASEVATTLVLLKDHREVKRISIRLRHDELNVLRL